MMTYVTDWSDSDIKAIVSSGFDGFLRRIVGAYDQIPQRTRQALQLALRRRLETQHDPTAAKLLMVFAEHWERYDVCTLDDPQDVRAFAELATRLAPEVSTELRRAFVQELLQRLEGCVGANETGQHEAAAILVALQSFAPEISKVDFERLLRVAAELDLDIERNLVAIVARPATKALAQQAEELVWPLLDARFDEQDAKKILKYANGKGAQFEGTHEAARWIYQTRVPRLPSELLGELGVDVPDEVRDMQNPHELRSVIHGFLLLGALPPTLSQGVAWASLDSESPLGLQAEADKPLREARDKAEQTVAKLTAQVEQAERKYAQQITALRQLASDGLNIFDRIGGVRAHLTSDPAASNEGQFRAAQERAVKQIPKTEHEFQLLMAELMRAKQELAQLEAVGEFSYWLRLRAIGDVEAADLHALRALGTDPNTFHGASVVWRQQLGLDPESEAHPAVDRLIDAGVLRSDLPRFASRQEVVRFLSESKPSEEQEEVYGYALDRLDRDRDLSIVLATLFEASRELSIIQTLAFDPSATKFDAYVNHVKERAQHLRDLLRPHSEKSLNPIHQAARELSDELSFVSSLPTEHPAYARLKARDDAVSAFLELVEGEASEPVHALLDTVCSKDFDNNELLTLVRQHGPGVVAMVAGATLATMVTIKTCGTGAGIWLLVVPATSTVGGFVAQEAVLGTNYLLRRKSGLPWSWGVGDSKIRRYFMGEKDLRPDGEFGYLSVGDVLAHSGQQMAVGYFFGVLTAGTLRFVGAPLAGAFSQQLGKIPALPPIFRAPLDKLLKPGVTPGELAKPAFWKTTMQETWQETVPEQLVAASCDSVVPGSGDWLTPLFGGLTGGLSSGKVNTPARPQPRPTSREPADASEFERLLSNALTGSRESPQDLLSQLAAQHPNDVEPIMQDLGPDAAQLLPYLFEWEHVTPGMLAPVFRPIRGRQLNDPELTGRFKQMAQDAAHGYATPQTFVTLQFAPLPIQRAVYAEIRQDIWDSSSKSFTYTQRAHEFAVNFFRVAIPMEQNDLELMGRVTRWPATLILDEYVEKWEEVLPDENTCPAHRKLGIKSLLEVAPLMEADQVEDQIKDILALGFGDPELAGYTATLVLESKNHQAWVDLMMDDLLDLTRDPSQPIRLAAWKALGESDAEMVKRDADFLVGLKPTEPTVAAEQLSGLIALASSVNPKVEMRVYQTLLGARCPQIKEFAIEALLNKVTPTLASPRWAKPAFREVLDILSPEDPRARELKRWLEPTSAG